MNTSNIRCWHNGRQHSWEPGEWCPPVAVPDPGGSDTQTAKPSGLERFCPLCDTELTPSRGRRVPRGRVWWWCWKCERNWKAGVKDEARIKDE